MTPAIPPKYQKLYKRSKETIERVFADAKEKHVMRYTQYRGLVQVPNWEELKFAAMNPQKAGQLAVEGGFFRFHFYPLLGSIHQRLNPRLMHEPGFSTGWQKHRGAVFFVFGR